jgi:hypothetical protein
MSEPTLATIAELSARTGEISDLSRALALLADASALIRAEANYTWIDADGEPETVPALIVMVCCKVVERVLSNPDGLSGEAIGGYSAQFSNASTDVYLTKQERRLVRKAAGTTPIGTIELQTPYRKYDVEDIYMTVDNGGEELPMGPWPEPSDG